MVFMILLAVVLIGYLSVAVMNSSDSDSANIDSETLAVKTSQLRNYVGELERGIRYIQQNDTAEDDFRFAHADADSDYGTPSTNPQNQLFHPSGGGALYRSPPSGINDGSMWEFYGGTAVPAIGSNLADLTAVLPNVTQSFCDYINTANSQPLGLQDTNACIYQGATERFSDSDQYDSAPNTMDESTFAQDDTISAVKPAPQACVRCTADGNNHFYHVLYAR